MAEVLGVIASISAILKLSTTVVQHLQNGIGGSLDRLRIRDEIRSTACLLEMLKDHAEDEQTRSIWLVSIRSLKTSNGPLEQFKRALELLVAKLAPSNRLIQLAQSLKWPFDRVEVAEILKTLERQKLLFSLAMQNDHLELSQEILKEVQRLSSGVSQLQVNQRGFENGDILAWISPVNFCAKHIDILNRRQEGTGQWLLGTDEFDGWVTGRERTLWCPGIRAGKTVLAATIVDHLQKTFSEPEFAIAFIYCNYRERDEQTVSNLVASLLQQLIQSSGCIPPAVQSLYEHYKRRRTRPNLVDFVRLLRTVVAQYSKFFLVIDALDECSETDHTRTNLLMEIRKLPSNLHLLCTSRFFSDIDEIFKDTPRIEIRASNTDVQKYLEAQIEKEGRLKRHIDTDPSLLEEIVDTIIARVQGMFLLAQLNLKSLARKHSRKAVRSALRNLPGKLDDTYEEALQRIYSQDADDIQLAERILMWICFATRPLTVTEVQHGVAVMELEQGDARIDDEGLPQSELLITVCAGIVTIDIESNIIRLVHYTTQEYFERVRLLKFPSAQASISEACIDYLTLETFSNGPYATDKDMEGCLRTHPLLHYAARNWGNHIRGLPELHCKDAVFDFFQQKTALQVAIQARSIPEHRYENWSQTYPLQLPTIVFAASFGLDTIVQLLIADGADFNASGSNNETALMVAANEGYESIVAQLLVVGAHVEAEDMTGWTALVKAASNGHQKTVTRLLDSVTGVIKHKEIGLMQAAKNGHLAVVTQLLKAGADADAIDDKDGLTALMLAADQGHAAVVTELLLAGADCEIRGFTSNRTALMRAADCGHEAVVSCLIAAGADVAAKDKASGRNALMRASRNGHTAVVELLLLAGSDLTLRDNGGWTSLMGAVDHGHEAVVEHLLRTGANTKDSSDWSALMRAAVNGHRAMVKKLLIAGADIEARDTGELTALIHKLIVQDLIAARANVAAKKSTGYTATRAAAGQEDIIEVLDAARADVSQPNATQRTDLVQAAAEGQEQMTNDLLLEGCMDINSKDTFGWTALMQAADNGRTTIATKLLAAGADLEVKDRGDWTALMRAANQGHATLVDLLLAAGADFKPKTLTGWTALTHAANNGNKEIVCRLLTAGANPSSKDLSEWSLLMRASDNGHKEVVKLLLDAGADTAARDRSGWTVLMRAADNGYDEIVKALAGAGADMSAKDYDECSPLMRAAGKGHEKAVRQLLLAGADVTVKSQPEWIEWVKGTTPGHETAIKEIVAASIKAIVRKAESA